KFNQLSKDVGGEPSAIAVADFDGDGKLDLAITRKDKNDVVTFRGKGDGTWENLIAYPVGTAPIALASGNFDNDQLPRPDLVVLNQTDKTFSMLAYNGRLPATGRGTWLSMNSAKFEALTLNAISPSPASEKVWLEGAHDNGHGWTDDNGAKW